MTENIFVHLKFKGLRYAHFPKHISCYNSLYSAHMSEYEKVPSILVFKKCSGRGNMESKMLMAALLRVVWPTAWLVIYLQ